ncbi:cupin domain-containing protein [Stella sp.]|uniref:cupin domain-containing protein n=1 Tax=Stella sp. TaxID=2912054 RepID=UPI0035B31C7A
MSTASIRFHPEGPGGAGLEDWGALPAEALESGEGRQRGRYFFQDERLGLSAGVWDCTPFVGRMGPHGNNELMLLLEGEVTIEPEAGEAVTVRAGEAFYLPKGLRVRWRQPGRVRKYFVIFDGPADAPAPATVPPLRIDPAAALAPSTPPAADTLFGPVPSQQGKAAFIDATGQFTIGVWETTPYHRRPVPFPRYELMHVLDGGVTVRGADGTAESYGPGDTFFVARGMVGDFEVRQGLRKIYAIFIEKPAA